MEGYKWRTPLEVEERRNECEERGIWERRWMNEGGRGVLEEERLGRWKGRAVQEAAGKESQELAALGSFPNQCTL